MNLNSVDWSHAQSLLLQLVQALSPLTIRTIPASFFLNRRFFNPLAFQEEGSEMKRGIRILTSLHQVQKQVDNWIDLPEEEVVNLTKAKEETSSDQPKKGDQARKPYSQVETMKNKEFPLREQAQKLIHEVQDAIGRLSNSKFLQDPQEKLLRDTLLRLKPNLDRIVQTMRDEEGDLAQEKLPATPKTQREELIQKLTLRAQKRILRQAALLSKSESSQFRELERGGGKEYFDETSLFRSVEKGSATQTKEAVLLKQMTALPGAPFTPESKRLIQGRKKKKRKSFWFKEKKDENPS